MQSIPRRIFSVFRMSFSLTSIRRYISLGLITAFIISPITTQSFAETNAFITLVTVDFDVNLRSDRKEIAKALFKDLDAFKAYIPSLKPAQAEWIKAEEISLKKLSGLAFKKKHEAILRSEENQLRSLHEMVNQILLPLKKIIEENELPIQKETSLWAWSNWALTDISFDGAIGTLSKLGVISLSNEIKEKFGLSITVEDEPWFTYTIIARQIQKEIVIPMCLFPPDRNSSN